MAYNTNASLDKLTCTDYVDFGKRQDQFGHFSWSKNDSNYFDGCKSQSIQESWQERVPTGPKSFNGEADFNQFMRLRNQLVNAAENFAREENSTPVLIPTLSRDMDEQLKVAQK